MAESLGSRMQIALAILVAAGGCNWTGDEAADGSGDGVEDDDHAAESGDEADTAAGCTDGWLDPTTGLCWQDPPDETMRSWDGAMAYCDGLVLGGNDNWRVPTIDELRSLVRGCPDCETGGACGVAGACLEVACWTDLCEGCAYRGGPGSAGAYWPSELQDAGPRWYWSSSAIADDSRMRWAVGFEGGYVGIHAAAVIGSVRCLRPEP